jgi:hypothetical protein
MATPNTKRFSGRIRKCALCQASIVFALTVATERGTGGKWMPIDIEPNPEGRVAVRDTGRTLLARSLAADETHDTTNEVLATPHPATCAARHIGDEAEQFLRDLATGDTDA